MNSIAVGIDVSKDHLDVYIDRLEGTKRLKFGNDPQGIRLLGEHLGSGSFVIALEASGRYEAPVRHFLEKTGRVVRMQNPRLVRRLAQGLGVQAKTDLVDAQLLAHTLELCPRGEARSQERERLGDLSRTISMLKRERASHLRRLQVPGLAGAVSKSLGRLVKVLAKEIELLEKAFEKDVAESSLEENYRLSRSVDGVGPALARTAVCELPQIIQGWSGRQLGSYAGLVPYDNTSGKRKSPARLGRHGNIHLKAALYMPAMNLISRDTWARSLYSKLRSKGLAHQQAIVPVMRKLLLQIVAVLKRGSAWQTEPPQRT